MMHPYGDPVFTYKGVCYVIEEEHEEDNVKSFHETYTVEDDIKRRGKSIPFSPYRIVPRFIFHKWVDCGQPTYEQLGGHQIEHHEAYYDKWVNEQLEKEFDL